MLNDLLHRTRSLVRREAVEGELDDELRFHFERHVENSVAAGLTREEAVRRARLEFGGFDQVKEESRDARGVQLMENLIQDVRYALRTLAKSPGFTAVALLTLALGIGANTAIFSVVYGVMLAPLPYKDSARLMVLNETTPLVGSVSVSYLNFLDWRAQSHSYSQIAAVAQTGWNMSGGSQPETVNGEAVSPAYLSMLGVRPMMGRDFDASEEKPGTNRVALLHYPMWQSHFGADPNVLGKTIALDGQSFTIIGVLPAGFRSLNKLDVMVPIGVWASTDNTDATERGARGDMVAVGRLSPGVSEKQARTEIEGIARRLALAYPAENDKFGAELTPIREDFAGNLSTPLLVLGGAVMFVLLIACANVANLLLMRGAARTREIALRIALGAGRGRIILQMLTESFVLAGLGGMLGIAFAFEMVRGLIQVVPATLLAGATIQMNGTVLLFAGAIAVLAALIFGLAPATRLANPDVQSSLKESGRSASASARQMNLRDLLAIGEVAIALILLVGAGLMMKSFYRLLAVNPGFRPERVLTMEFGLRSDQYKSRPAILNFWQQAIEKVRAIPGVESAAVGTVIPMANQHSRSDITIEGMEMPSPGSFPHPDVHIVSGDFVSTLGLTMLRGRVITDADIETTQQVGMINQKLAQKYFPNTDSIGKRFAFGHANTDPNPKWFTIVGVVRDTSLYGLANPARLEVYLPYRQRTSSHMNLVVKSGMDPAALTSAIRGAIATIDKDQPMFAISTMTDLISASVSTNRLTLVLLGLFGTLALVLASIGIYGVISYSVTQRTHEIGVRMALGAARADVLRMVLGHGVRIAGIGVAIGLAASFGLMRLIVTLLYSVSAADPLTFAGVATALLVVAMLACFIPARRTLRVDPMTALRYE